MLSILKSWFSVVHKFLWLFLILLCSFRPVQAGTTEANTDSKFYTLLVNGNLPPIAFIENKHLRGVAVDLAKSALRAADVEGSIQGKDWATAQELVRAGDADGLVYINKTPERLKTYLFSEPLFVNEFMIFTNPETKALGTLESLKGLTVGAEQKGYARSVLEKNDIRIKTYPDYPSVLRALSRGEIDAVYGDRWVTEYTASKIGLSFARSIESLERAEVYVAFNKNNPELLTAFNKGLATIRANGVYDRVMSSWSDDGIVYISEQELVWKTAQNYIILLGAVTLVFGIMWFRASSLKDKIEALNNQLAQNNKELTSANQAKTRFLGAVSHELRTPLNGINGLLFTLKKKVKDEHAQEDLGKLETAVRHLNGLISEVLDINKIEHGKMELSLQPVSVVTLTNSVLDMVADSARLKDVSLALSNSNDLPSYVHADTQRIRQILLNYLSNAIKFTREGGTVKLSTNVLRKSSGEVCVRFTVADTGIGISAEDQGHLFKLFEQANANVSQKYGGTGLGLALVKSLTELMNGKVGFKSSLGVGSEFWVDLPLMISSGEPVNLEEDESADCAETQCLEGLNILVVDDQELNVLVAENVLQAFGAKTMSAGDGEAALNILLNEFKADVVLMDIHMPIMDGLTATKQIRANPALKGIRVVGLTGAAMMEDKQAAIEAGMDCVLIKPFEPDTLTQACLRDKNSAGRALTQNPPNMG